MLYQSTVIGVATVATCVLYTILNYLPLEPAVLFFGHCCWIATHG